MPLGRFSPTTKKMLELIDASPEPISSSLVRIKMKLSEKMIHYCLYSLEFLGKICALRLYRKNTAWRSSGRGSGPHKTGEFRYYTTCKNCPLFPCPKDNKGVSSGGLPNEGCRHRWDAKRNKDNKRTGAWVCQRCGLVIEDDLRTKMLDFLWEQSHRPVEVWIMNLADRFANEKEEL